MKKTSGSKKMREKEERKYILGIRQKNERTKIQNYFKL